MVFVYKEKKGKKEEKQKDAITSLMISASLLQLVLHDRKLYKISIIEKEVYRCTWKHNAGYEILLSWKEAQKHKSAQLDNVSRLKSAPLSMVIY